MGQDDLGRNCGSVHGGSLIRRRACHCFSMPWLCMVGGVPCGLVIGPVKVPRYFDAGHVGEYETMKIDQIRPEWRGFMLLVSRLGVSPLIRGVLPCPIITFEDCGLRDRLLAHSPNCKSLLEKGSCSAVAIMEILQDNEVAPGVSIEVMIELQKLAYRARRGQRKKSFSPQDVQQLVNAVGLDRLSVPDNCAQAESSMPDGDLMKWIQWHLGINMVSIFQWGIPFPFLLRIAREASGPVAKTALARAIAIDKPVLGLSWAIQRLEEAALRNDKAFMREIGEALATATIPRKLKAEALDFFLCMFDPWLREMPLMDQVALLREGGITMSVKALRNRRSRLRLSKINKSAEVEIPKELQPLPSRQRTYS